MTERLKILAFTHKNMEPSEFGKLHRAEEERKENIIALKNALQADELMYLSTCNRVEIIFVSSQPLGLNTIRTAITQLNTSLPQEEVEALCTFAECYEGPSAVNHLFRVASSLDSLVVGEREIITQVRNAYEQSHEFGVSGDFIRLLIKQTIETAKEVYTQTNIARNPVSVVSLAYRKLRDLNVPDHARFVIIGAGVTNTNMVQYLRKHQYSNFTVFNRSLNKAEQLAGQLQNASAYPLSEITNYHKGFDVIITCTGSELPVLTPEIYQSLLTDEKDRKIVIDLAVPNDLDPEVLKRFDVNLIAVNNLREIAEENLKARKQELDACEQIISARVETLELLLKERKVELAFGEIPKKVKEIRETAINEVFKKEIKELPEESVEVIEKIVAYMEKKYNAVAMKTAKDVLLQNS